MHQEFQGSCFTLLSGGDYVQLVDLAFRPDSVLSECDIPWVIGGLTLVGRREEAEGLLRSWVSRLTTRQRIAAQFFIGVALTREGRYQSARTLFQVNRQDALGDADALSEFFAHQGLAFFRYATGRLLGARLWAEAAVRSAAAASFCYGAVLAHELLGHVQMSLGTIHRGLRTLGLAKQKAEALGQGALQQAMDVSILLYRVTYGLAMTSQDLVQDLEQALANCRFEDSYTRASLLLALARVRLLQGKGQAARQLIESASELVYHIDNPGLEINYNLLLARRLQQEGQTLQALSLVRGARHRAQTQPDLKSLLRIHGLEAQLSQTLGRRHDSEFLNAKIEDMTRKSGSLLARRILGRQQGKEMVDIRPGEDPLGDLIDQTRRFPSAALPVIFQTGWLSLLPEALSLKQEDFLLYFDAEPGSLTILSRGELFHQSEGLSELIRKLLLILSHGEISKEMLTIQLWGKAYNPLRDDRLIYALVAKSRRLLGAFGEWIEVCEVGYRLKAGVQVVARALEARPETSRGRPLLPSRTLDDRFLSVLNTRQVAVLNWMQAGEVVEPRTVMDRLHVSDATVTRDMAGLLNLGLIRRQGKGRATRYILAPS